MRLPVVAEGTGPGVWVSGGQMAGGTQDLAGLRIRHNNAAGTETEFNKNNNYSRRITMSGMAPSCCGCPCTFPGLETPPLYLKATFPVMDVRSECLSCEDEDEVILYLWGTGGEQLVDGDQVGPYRGFDNIGGGRSGGGGGGRGEGLALLVDRGAPLVPRDVPRPPGGGRGSTGTDSERRARGGGTLNLRLLAASSTLAASAVLPIRNGIKKRRQVQFNSECQ